MVHIDGPNGNITASGTITAVQFVGPFRESPSLVDGLPTTDDGPPTAGTFIVGDVWVDSLGAKFRCTVAGTPGTWVQIAPAFVAAFPGSPLTNYLVAWESEGWRQYFYNGSIWVPVFTGAKIYRALLSQAGTGAPVATVLVNMLSGAIVWARGSTGSYTGTLTGAFPAGKVFILTSSLVAFSTLLNHVLAARNDDNVITLLTKAIDVSAGTVSSADDVLSGTSIEIAVYP